MPASPGVAIGRVFHLRQTDEVPQERATDPSHERRALDAAIARAHRQLEALQLRLAEEGDADRAAIFAAHQELLADPELLDGAAEQIQQGATAAYAWRQAYRQQADRLAGPPHRAARGPRRRPARRGPARAPPPRGSRWHAARDPGGVDRRGRGPRAVRCRDARSHARLGFCTTTGSATSHVAILARGLGVPAVAGIDPRALELPAGARVVLDGDAGTLRRDPSPAEEAEIAPAPGMRPRGRVLRSSRWPGSPP